MNSLVPVEQIEKSIFLFRGHKVMLDSRLATLYGVSLKVLNQAVKRNNSRFPVDFMFQLSREEFQSLRSQFVTLEKGRGKYSKYLPYVFTEQGVAMLSSVLNSERAIQVNIVIIRTFVRIRSLIASNKDLAVKLAVLERKYDGQFKVVFDAIRKLMEAPPKKSPAIGFHSKSQFNKNQVDKGLTRS
jgi:ORF6N domain-containing protein